MKKERLSLAARFWADATEIYMTFRRINNTTINCIITAEDLSKNGIQIDDLFDRKQEAVEFIREIVAHAARSENFDLSSGRATMKMTVLPDRSISLTISEDPAAAEGVEEIVHEALPASSKNTTASKAVDNRYLFRFYSMFDVIDCCHFLAVGGSLSADLLHDEEFGDYYLLIGRDKDSPEDLNRLILAANEFGTMITSNELYISFIREHTTCMIEKDAVRILAEV